MDSKHGSDEGFLQLLARCLPTGTEDTFTGILSGVLGFVPSCIDVLIDWIDAECRSELRALGPFHVVGRKSFGDSNPDLILESRGSPVDVWCEHKIDSPEGKSVATETKEAITQLNKYQQAAEKHASATGRRVFIVPCSRARWQIRLVKTDGGSVRLLARGGESLRWRDLYERISEFAVRSRASLNPLQAAVLDDLLAYWRGLRHMRRAKTVPGWIPSAKVTEEEEETWYEIWESVYHSIKDVLPGSRFGQAIHGGSCGIVPGHPTITHISIRRTEGGEHAPWPTAWPGDAVELLFKLSSRPQWIEMVDHNSDGAPFIVRSDTWAGQRGIVGVAPISDWSHKLDSNAATQLIAGVVRPVIEHVFGRFQRG